MSQQVPFIITGFEAIVGKPYDFKNKILSPLLISSNNNGTTTQNRKIIQEMMESWIRSHGIFYQYGSQRQKENRVTIKSILLLQEEIEKTIKDNYKEEDNKLKLLILRNSSKNYKIYQNLAKFQIIRIPQQVSFIKSLKRKYTLCNSRYSSSQIAKVLCWTTYMLLSSISSSEFSKCSWMKATKHKKSPNICRSIRFFNFLSHKVATEIIMVRETSVRAQFIERIIEIAYHAKQENNFEVVSALISGLNSCSISPNRLKKSWSLVSKKLCSIFDELESMVAPISNYSNYRQIITKLIKSEQIFVPCLSVILRDIVSADVNEFNRLSSSDIPFDQIMIFGKIIWPILQLQMNPSCCNFKMMDQQFNDHYFILQKILLYPPASENLLMRLSYKREPPKNLQLLCDDDQFSPVSCSSDYSSISNDDNSSNNIKSDISTQQQSHKPQKHQKSSPVLSSSCISTSFDSNSLSSSPKNIHSSPKRHRRNLSVSTGYIRHNRNDHEEEEEDEGDGDDDDTYSSFFSSSKKNNHKYPSSSIQFSSDYDIELEPPTPDHEKSSSSLRDSNSENYQFSSHPHPDKLDLNQTQNLSSNDHCNQLLSSPTSTSSSSNYTEGSFENLAKLWSNALSKDPVTWNKLEVQVILESWGLPPELCIRLSQNFIKDGSELLKFVPSEELVPQSQYRVLINNNLEELLSNRVASFDLKDHSNSNRNSNNIVSWNSENVSSWLHSKSLEKFALLFDENGITGRKLLTLTGADLMEMGVEKPSARKKILKEIKKLGNNSRRFKSPLAKSK